LADVVDSFADIFFDIRITSCYEEQRYIKPYRLDLSK